MDTKEFKGKTLLITGGTGSFGSAILDRFKDEPLKEIRIFSRDEKKQDDLRRQINSEKVKFYIGDVRDESSIQDAMVGVDFVFHAAALKQVPSCEFYPLEAVRTNVLGTDNVLKAAVAAGVRKVVVLSTDKAVYPINAMGISKSMMEKIMIARARVADPAKTIICGTRYGNVLASRGSVVPLFISQIEAGLPLTVTDPNMTRFLMTLDDAVDLVLYAFSNATSGDIFVQKSPAARIVDLAESTLELFQGSGPVKVIGTRHGEKKHEVLLNREERSRSIDLGKWYRIPSDTRSLNYGQYFVEGEPLISQEEDYTSENTVRLDKAEIKDLLLQIPLVKERLEKVDGRQDSYSK